MRFQVDTGMFFLHGGSSSVCLSAAAAAKPPHGAFEAHACFWEDSPTSTSAPGHKPKVARKKKKKKKQEERDRERQRGEKIPR